MFMNRKTDYALRIIRALTDQKRHTASDLAGNEQIPLAFTYKILKRLSRAGIISLERGPGGGCRLQADLKRISLYDLILIMEGEADMTACMTGHYDCSWRKSHGICKIHLNLMAVQKEINQKLQSKSLWDIIGKTT